MFCSRAAISSAPKQDWFWCYSDWWGAFFIDATPRAVKPVRVTMAPVWPSQEANLTDSPCRIVTPFPSPGHPMRVLWWCWSSSSWPTYADTTRHTLTCGQHSHNKLPCTGNLSQAARGIPVVDALPPIYFLLLSRIASFFYLRHAPWKHEMTPGGGDYQQVYAESQRKKAEHPPLSPPTHTQLTPQWRWQWQSRCDSTRPSRLHRSRPKHHQNANNPKNISYLFLGQMIIIVSENLVG